MTSGFSLRICGDFYLRFLAANEQATATEADSVDLVILGLAFPNRLFVLR